jgi:hypothetical protein
LKKIVAMTQPKGNGGSNRRQPQDITSISKASTYTQEGVREDTGVKSSTSKAKSSSGESSGTSTGTDTPMKMSSGSSRKHPQATEEEGPKTMTETSGRGPKEENSELSNQDGEAKAGLAQKWPTPKESIAGATAGVNLKYSNSMRMRPKNQTQSMIPKENKKDKPSYPIFHRQGATTAARVKNNREVSDPNKLMTMAVPAASTGAVMGITRNGATAVDAAADKAKGRKDKSESTSSPNKLSNPNNSMEKTNNSSTMVPAPVVHGVTDAAKEEDNPTAMTSTNPTNSTRDSKAITNVEESKLNSVVRNTNNSTTTTPSQEMLPSISPTEGMSGKDEWHKVKPHKKKQQRKLTFKKTSPREASKSGPMEVDQSIKDSTGGGNRPTKTVTMVTPPQEPQRRESL